MPVDWITAAPGVRCYKHATRKHGKQLDRYYAIRYRVDGRRPDEGLGWASDGWTLDKALSELAKLKEAARTGRGETTLREKRVKAEQEREAEAERTRLEKTVNDLWSRYSKEVMAVKNKPRTVGEKNRMWTMKIKPAIGALRVNSVTGEDAGAIVRSPLKLDEKGIIIGGKAEGGNLYRLLHHMFEKALVWGLRSKALGNPLDTVDEPKTKRRERLLTAREIGALMGTLNTAPEGKWYPQIVAAVKAVILSGARIRELLSLRWSDVRRDEMEMHLRDTKTGFSRRPMSPDLLVVFDSLKKMPGSAFVFRGIEDPKKPLDYYLTRDTFREIAATAKVKNCTLHTIRHWYTTLTANSVSNPRVGMALTGHKSHEAYMRYVHGDKDQAKALAEQLAAVAVSFEQLPDNVERLPTKRRPKRRTKAV